MSKPSFAYYKANYFIDSKPVKDRVSAEKRRALMRGGGLVRTIARRSIRPARRKKLGELTPDQRAHHERRKRNARKRGRPAPKLGYASARAGEPPRNRTRVLKDGIFFGYDTIREIVLAGAVRRATNTAHVLEHGGHVTLPSHGKPVSMHYQGNPFMQPALKEAAPRLPPMFKNAIAR